LVYNKSIIYYCTYRHILLYCCLLLLFIIISYKKTKGKKLFFKHESLNNRSIWVMAAYFRFFGALCSI